MFSTSKTEIESELFQKDAKKKMQTLIRSSFLKACFFRRLLNTPVYISSLTVAA